MSQSTPAGQPNGYDESASLIISWLLIIGVALSALLLAVGMGLLVVSGGTGYHQSLAPSLILGRQGEVRFPHTFSEVFQGAAAAKPFAVIELGALLLIATPVARVAASAVLFLLGKDYLYTLITLTVLAILLTSIFWVS